MAVTGYEVLHDRMTTAIEGASGAIESLRAIGQALH